MKLIRDTCGGLQPLPAKRVEDARERADAGERSASRLSGETGEGDSQKAR